MGYNGPAIWEGCVSRRQRHCDVSALAGSVSWRKEGMAHFLPADSYRHGYKVCWFDAGSRYKVLSGR